MKAEHDTFTITRNYKCTPAQLFAAWADPKAKANWFARPKNWTQHERHMDFREGGTEVVAGNFGGRFDTLYTANYYDIVENERIGYAFQVRLGGEIYSISTAVVEFSEEDGGTKMEFTEQLFYLAGDKAAEATPARIVGTDENYIRLEEYISSNKVEV